jgi:hypothetical protein
VPTIETGISRPRRAAADVGVSKPSDQGLEKRLSLNQRKLRDVPIRQVQNIENIINDVNAALAVGGGLGVGEARQPGVVDAATTRDMTRT